MQNSDSGREKLKTFLNNWSLVVFGCPETTTDCMAQERPCLASQLKGRRALLLVLLLFCSAAAEKINGVYLKHFM